jgi:iron complex transport system ATP-binding protein
MEPIMTARGLRVSYGSKEVIRGLDLSVGQGKVTCIIGPNGCGKSTLLMALSRGLRPGGGTVSFMGKDVYAFSQKAFAREAAMLHQEHECPADLTVRELAEHGRFAYSKWWGGASGQDADSVERALRRTGMTEFAGRQVSTLSGGERQKAWISMLLAQDPRLLILDEPTTFLDIAHQLDVLELLSSLCREDGLTVIMVLHDINQAARYADELVIMKDGAVCAAGPPAAVLCPGALRDAFGVEVQTLGGQDGGQPYYVTVSACRRTS